MLRLRNEEKRRREKFGVGNDWGCEIKRKSESVCSLEMQNKWELCLKCKLKRTDVGGTCAVGFDQRAAERGAWYIYRHTHNYIQCTIPCLVPHIDLVPSMPSSLITYHAFQVFPIYPITPHHTTPHYLTSSHKTNFLSFFLSFIFHLRIQTYNIKTKLFIMLMLQQINIYDRSIHMTL